MGFYRWLFGVKTAFRGRLSQLATIWRGLDHAKRKSRVWWRGVRRVYRRTGRGGMVR